MQQKNKILILDDDDDMRELLGTVLRLKGYIVTAAKDAEPNSIKEKPDLIVLDVLLSGKSGIDVCSSFKKISSTKNIPVIMFSALPDAREKCLAAGADEFITKPFKIQALLNIINNLLQKNSSLTPGKKVSA